MTTAVGFAAERFLTEVLHAENVRIRGDEINHNCFLIQHSNDYKEPGASLNAEKLLWNCWKCSAGGTLKWITEEVLHVTSSKARMLIKDYFDSEEVHEETFLQILEADWRRAPVATMPRYNVRMIEGFQCYTKLMDSRGISREVQKEMMTGLTKMNTDEVEVNGETIQVVQPRIVIPHFFGGKLRGWTMRKADERQVGPKYKHTGDFPKRATLYNYDNARKYSDVFVVESPFSVLSMLSKGFPNTVGTFGAEVNSKQEDLLTDWDEIYLFPDGDRAGYTALSREDKRGNIEGLAHSLGTRKTTYVMDHGITDDGDWNELDAANYSREEVLALKADAIPTYSWDYVTRRGNAVPKVHAIQTGTSDDSGQWD